MSAAPRALILANPHGGRGRGPAVADQATRRLERAGWAAEVVFTQYPGHGGELATALEPGRWDALCVVGGDGSLREVVDGLLSGGQASTQGVCLVPAGTGNALAGDLGLGGPDDAIDRLLGAAERFIDVARVETDYGQVHHACDLVGWGLAADAGRWAERLRWLGPPRYFAGSALAALTAPARSMEVRFDGQAEALCGPVDLIIASNTRRTGAGMVVAPDAQLDDGLLDVLLVRGLGRARRLALLPKLGRGDLGDAPEVLLRRARTLDVRVCGESPLNLDGDLLPTSRTAVRVLPRALRLLA